ncbi:MAG: hypothetical protein LBS71_02425 [Puniceicoccales bacterium]|jgi:hypothetical protein|nr:hypothetical protein [Puniceicoccales bacterium]
MTNKKYYVMALSLSCLFCTEMMQGGISPARPVNIEEEDAFSFFINRVKENKINNDARSLSERIKRLEQVVFDLKEEVDSYMDILQRVIQGVIQRAANFNGTSGLQSTTPSLGTSSVNVSDVDLNLGDDLRELFSETYGNKDFVSSNRSQKNMYQQAIPSAVARVGGGDPSQVVSAEAQKIYGAMAKELNDRFNQNSIRLNSVPQSQEFSLESITNDWSINQVIQAIKNGNGNVNTLAELVREKIPQFDFRKNDYKVKELIHSFLRELKQQRGLQLGSILEIYYAIMQEKPSLLAKKTIERIINE